MNDQAGTSIHESGPQPVAKVAGRRGIFKPADCSTLGSPRTFPGTRFVYCLLSQRVRGLTLGVDLCPTRFCNFRCVYCQVDRSQPKPEIPLNLEVLSEELANLLALVHQGQLSQIPEFNHVPKEWLRLREVVLSGEGEPTLCPQFAEVVQAIIHVRAACTYPFFKIALATNGTGLNLPEVQRGLARFNSRDEVWIKLDAGTQAYMQRVNRSTTPLQRVLDNILHLGQQRPVVIQSLFAQLEGAAPPEEEIRQYILRLKELKERGAQIALVQIYSARSPTDPHGCSHLPLRCLSGIARQVREQTGLTVDVF